MYYYRPLTKHRMVKTVPLTDQATAVSGITAALMWGSPLPTARVRIVRVYNVAFESTICIS